MIVGVRKTAVFCKREIGSSAQSTRCLEFFPCTSSPSTPLKVNKKGGDREQTALFQIDDDTLRPTKTRGSSGEGREETHVRTLHEWAESSYLHLVYST